MPKSAEEGARKLLAKLFSDNVSTGQRTKLIMAAIAAENEACALIVEGKGTVRDRRIFADLIRARLK